MGMAILGGEYIVSVRPLPGQHAELVVQYDESRAHVLDLNRREARTLALALLQAVGPDPGPDPCDDPYYGEVPF